jgi:hypothetical protein
MCMFAANYDYYDSQNSEDYPRAQYHDNTYPVLAVRRFHNLLALVFRLRNREF